MSFFFFSDASAKESTEIKVFDPNLKMSDQEMLDLLKEVDLESHGYKKEKTTKLACVASVSSRVIARKLEREQKKMEGGGGGEKRKRLPANPTILENAPWYFTVRFICKLTARQDR